MADECLWKQLGEINGIMIRCLQKGIRQLIRASKLNVNKLVAACEKAICLGRKDKSLAAKWSFAWWVLEELAHGSKLLGAVKGRGISFITECYYDIEQSSLPASYLDGYQRILRVIQVLTSAMPTKDVEKIARRIEKHLLEFNLPTATVAAAVSALYELHLATGTSESATTCFTALMNHCEDQLASFLMAEQKEDPVILERPMFTLGEIAVVGFDKDDDKSKEGYKVALIQIPKRIVSVLFSFLAASVSSNDDQSTLLPSQVRAVAFLSVGKICLRDEVRIWTYFSF